MLSKLNRQGSGAWGGFCLNEDQKMSSGEMRACQHPSNGGEGRCEIQDPFVLVQMWLRKGAGGGLPAERHAHPPIKPAGAGKAAHVGVKASD